MPDKPSALSKARRKLSKLAKAVKISSRGAAPAPSPFLQLPREIRNMIYDFAILSSARDRETVVDDPRFTDRPLYKTVTAAVNTPATRRRSLLERLHLRREQFLERELRAAFDVRRRASPANLLLTCRQVSAEFAAELHLRCKLVGTVYRYDQIDGDAASFDALRASEILGVRLPWDFFSDGGSSGGNRLNLRHVRNWEVQFNLLFLANEATLQRRPMLLLRQGDVAAVAATLGHALALLPACRELTLRLTLGPGEIHELLHVVRRTSRAAGVALFRPFFEQLELPKPHGVTTLTKALTVGFGDRRDPATARQVFAVRKRVEQWDEQRGEMKVVSDEEKDWEYINFYGRSMSHGYLWVQKQFHPYRNFGRPGSYQAALAAMDYGYKKWVDMGKPRWYQTPEHRQMVGRWGTIQAWDADLWEQMVSEVAQICGFY